MEVSHFITSNASSIINKDLLCSLRPLLNFIFDLCGNEIELIISLKCSNHAVICLLITAFQL